MAIILKPLTAQQVKNAKPSDSPLRDGEGLTLKITDHSKKWRFEYAKPFTKKRTVFTFGSYPEISLQEARGICFEFRTLLLNNIDPQAHLLQRQQQALEEKQNTLIFISQKWRDFKAKKVESETMKEDWARLENHIFPKLGDLSVRNINSRILIETLSEVYQKGHTSVIEKVLRTVNGIMDYAENIGVIESHNCHKAIKGFHIKPATNHPTIRPEDVPTFFNRLSSARIQPKTLCLILWSFLTAVRPAEAVSIEWTEIDNNENLWHIPAEKMKKTVKGARSHTVPLSTQAQQILAVMRSLPKGQFVFHSVKSLQKAMSSESVNMALKRNGYQGILTSHGIRSIFSTYLNELGENEDVIEAALAHDVKGKVRKVYNRAEYLEMRVFLMQKWGDYLDQCGLQRLLLQLRPKPVN